MVEGGLVNSLGLGFEEVRLSGRDAESGFPAEAADAGEVGGTKVNGETSEEVGEGLELEISR